MTDRLNRRMFLQLSGISLAVTAANPLYASLRARGDRLPASATSLGGGPVFVLVFLRGGCDGLNVCIPIEPGEHATYLGYRPNLRIDLASLSGTQLDSDFALHPALVEMYDSLYRTGRLAVLPNVHYANGSRSHFDSQAFYESGTPWRKDTPDGWLSRHMQTTPANVDVLRAVVFGSAVPAAFRGRPSALTFSSLSSLSVSGNPTRDAQFLDAQEQVYPLPLAGRKYDGDTLRAGQDLVAAIRAIRAANLPASRDPSRYPSTTFGTRMRELAQLVRSGAFAIELAQVDLGGFDTHTAQGGVTGAQASLLSELSRALDAFYFDLDTLGSSVVTLVVTEFGRTARENGNQGTDHGSAMCTFVAGGAVTAGVHFGPAGWHGLTSLRENRDLQHSIDYRDVYVEILARHLQSPAAASVFAGYTPAPVGVLP